MKTSLARRNIFLLVGLSLLCLPIACRWSCSKQSPKQKPIEEEADKGGLFLKWVLQLSGETVSSVELKKIDSSFTLVPHLAGNYAVVVWKGDKEIAVYPFKFESEVHLHGVDREGHLRESAAAITGNPEALVWIKVEEPIDKLSVISPSGETLLEITELSNGESLKRVKPKTSGWKFPREALAEETIYYRHIAFLTPQDSVFAGLQERLQGSLVEPTEELRRDIVEQISHAAPNTVSAVSAVGFGSFREEFASLCAATYYSTILVNTRRPRSECGAYFLHELAHSYERLLNFMVDEASGPRESWPEHIRVLAQETLDRLGLSFRMNFRSLWEEIHENAQRYRLTIDYVGEAFGNFTAAQAVGYGFATPYGMSAPQEDMAEYVRGVQGHALVGGELVICSELRRATRSFPLRLALPYIKVQMLKNAGFITPEKAERCYGDVAIRGEKGIHFLNEQGSKVMSFTRNPKAGYQREGDAPFFSILGDGPDTFQILIQVYQGGRHTPLGLYRLDSLWRAVTNTPRNGVYLDHENQFLSHASTSGLVLISEHTASPPKVEGAIFFMRLYNPGEDVMPLLGAGLPVFLESGDVPMATFHYEP